MLFQFRLESVLHELKFLDKFVDFHALLVQSKILCKIFVRKAGQLQFVLEVMCGFDGRNEVKIEIFADSKFGLAGK